MGFSFLFSKSSFETTLQEFYIPHGLFCYESRNLVSSSRFIFRPEISLASECLWTTPDRFQWIKGQTKRIQHYQLNGFKNRIIFGFSTMHIPYFLQWIKFQSLLLNQFINFTSSFVSVKNVFFYIDIYENIYILACTLSSPSTCIILFH